MPAGFIDPVCDRQNDGPVRLRLSTIGCAGQFMVLLFPYKKASTVTMTAEAFFD
jgi:hypothetical protein